MGGSEVGYNKHIYILVNQLNFTHADSILSNTKPDKAVAEFAENVSLITHEKRYPKAPKKQWRFHIN